MWASVGVKWCSTCQRCVRVWIQGIDRQSQFGKWDIVNDWEISPETVGQKTNGQ